MFLYNALYYITHILFGLLSEAIKYFLFIVKANKGILKKKEYSEQLIVIKEGKGNKYKRKAN